MAKLSVYTFHHCKADLQSMCTFCALKVTSPTRIILPAGKEESTGVQRLILFNMGAEASHALQMPRGSRLPVQAHHCWAEQRSQSQSTAPSLLE